MAFARIDETLNAIEKNTWLGGAYGKNYADQIRRRLAGKNLPAIDSALSLGTYLVHSQQNKEQRQALRALLLAEFVVRNRLPQQKQQLMARWKGRPRDQIAAAFREAVGPVWDNQKRQLWAPVHFTDPDSTTGRALQKRQDWRSKAIPPFRFLVHSLLHSNSRLPSAEKVLADPEGTLSGWDAISCSIISDAKPQPYGNMGLILRVSERNILTTSSHDQQFQNHIGTKFGRTPEEATGGLANQFKLARHVAEKNAEYGGLLSPDEVIANQGVSPNGETVTPHNEIVVVGRPGVDFGAGATQPIRVTGLFIRVDYRGETYRDRFAGEMSVKALHVMKHAAERLGLPLLWIPDKSGRRGAG